MNKAIDNYLTFIFETILTDVQKYENFGWWNLTIIVPTLYGFFILLKYLVLTIPIWVPVNMVSANIKGIFFYSKKIVKNKMKKEENIDQ